MAGIYIHIPFCKTRCIYCDFFSCTLEKDISPLISGIIKEIDLKKDYVGEEVIETIYFGGGTPSFISTLFIQQILDEIQKQFKISTSAEITIEVNPDDISEKKAIELFAMGINRISMGVQSFEDKILRFLGRRHNAKQAISAFEILKNTGFKNISLDLIYGIPGLSLKDWKNTLEQIVILAPQHISAYHLTIEKGTSLHKLLIDNKINTIPDQDSVQQYIMLSETLKNHRYFHYEISNFAKPRFESKHNSGYWFGKKYIGLGPSAHSFDGNTRQWNLADIHKYIERVHTRCFYFKKEALTKKKRYNEFLMTRLRTLQGIQITELETQFGKDYLQLFSEGIKKQELYNNIIQISSGNYIIPENKWFISDSIISDLFKV